MRKIYETCNFTTTNPENFEAAIKQDEWIKEMEEEIKMIKKNDTRKMVDRPKEKEIIGVKMVYKTKP